MVGGDGIEPTAFSVSRRRSPTELTAHDMRWGNRPSIAKAPGTVKRFCADVSGPFLASMALTAASFPDRAKELDARVRVPIAKHAADERVAPMHRARIIHAGLHPNVHCNDAIVRTVCFCRAVRSVPTSSFPLYHRLTSAVSACYRKRTFCCNPTDKSKKKGATAVMFLSEITGMRLHGQRVSSCVFTSGAVNRNGGSTLCGALSNRASAP